MLCKQEASGVQCVFEGAVAVVWIDYTAYGPEWGRGARGERGEGRGGVLSPSPESHEELLSLVLTCLVTTLCTVQSTFK